MSFDPQLSLLDTTRAEVPRPQATSNNHRSPRSDRAGHADEDPDMTTAMPAKSSPSTTKTSSGNDRPASPDTKTARPPANGGKGARKKRSAEHLAQGQRDISVSEFFVKNRHLLGFDSPTRALLTTVKEAVDNALDACEEAGILPTILVEIEQTDDDRYVVALQDNGPGIVVGQVPKIFGKLLYGSKFHSLKQSRGQQGIGISAAGMYGQLTTGKPVRITSRTQPRYSAHYLEVIINTKRNAPEVIRDTEVEWDEPHGTRVEIELEGSYKSGKHSVDEYLEQTALANPHAEIFYYPPKGREEVVYPRLTEELPAEPAKIKPHPYGVELGILMKMLKDSKARHITTALKEDFSRVTPKVAEEICKTAGVSLKARPTTIANREAEALYKAIQKVKIRNPALDCIVPIGEELIRRGLEREIKDASFYSVRTRPPRVYRGNPFQVEVGLAYGGQLTGLIDHGDLSDDGAWVGGVRLNPTKKVEVAMNAIPGITRKKAVHLLLKAGIDRATKAGMLTDAQVDLLRDALNAEARSETATRPIHLVRLANRVPLQYQQSSCAIHKAVTEVNWRRYQVNQSRGGLPQGPLVLVVHIASVWVPFTSESKEAIAHYAEIIDEIKRCVMDCGRELGSYLSRRQKHKALAERRSKFDLYCGELVEALHHLTRRKRTDIKKILDRAADHYAEVSDEF
jgi:DNA topoisomerase-6 subunit B